MKPTLKLSLSSLLDDGLDLIVRSSLLNANSQINNGDVGSWDTHGHSGELAVELWDDLSDSLGGTGAGRNDVLGSGTTSTPVLSRWTINGLLGSSVGVDGGHETLDNGEVIVDNLGERGKAVGGARCVGDNVNVGLVGLLVDTHDVHRSIGRRSRDDNLLGSSLQVCLCLLGGSEDTGGLDDVVGTGLAPWDVGGVTGRVELDDLAIDLKTTLDSLDGTLESTVGGVVLKHVDLAGCEQWWLGLGAAHRREEGNGQ